ncbi:MAG: ABC transporter permease [Candidatus Nanohaloarchaea archaeon]
MKVNRIEALVMKYYFNMKRNLDRIFDIFYWPVIGLFTWGFTTLYLEDVTKSSRFISFFLSGLILWTMVQRSQQDFSTALLEDFWNQNIYNTFTSPLTNLDLFTATTLYAVSRALIAFTFMALLSAIFYPFNIFNVGLIAIALLSSLLVLFGSAIGTFVSGLIYRFGQRIQVFAWSTIMILQPFSLVYYPRETLPGVFKTVSFAIPTSYIFEGMRAAIQQNIIPWGQVQVAFLLTMVYLLAGYVFLAYMLEQSRQKGYLAQNA